MAKKSLGQHFLFDPAILGRIVEASGITSDDTVVEIGPGPGAMTRLLASKAKRLIAIELDDELFMRLLAEYEGNERVELHHADALKFDFKSIDTPFKVVANIPYYITTPLIFKVMEAKHLLRSMTLTIQKEVAERIVASPGNKDYGVLSLSVQYYADAKLKFIVPAGAFRPVPKVDSSVIRIDILDKPAVSVINETTFFKMIRAGFSQRRKTLSNSLKPLWDNVKELLIENGIDPMRRAETLSMHEFAALANTISKKEGRD
jgi:16S rRNA (adenine1518-N6/adenine1519-N6)-dimethyltransferase